MARQYRKFDEDFEHGAVQLVFETGKPIAQVARELGINEGTLGNWCVLERRKRDSGHTGLTEDERTEEPPDELRVALARHLERLDELLAALHLGLLGSLGHVSFPCWVGLTVGEVRRARRRSARSSPDGTGGRRGTTNARGVR